MKSAMTETVTGLFRAYGSILFAERALVGALFIVATFWFPNTALAGLLAALAGMVTAKLLQFRNLGSGLHIYNSLLVGLSLGAYYQLDLYLAVLIVLGAVLAVFATVAMADVLWRLDRLPALSLPFVMVALTVTLAAHSYGTLSRYLLPMAPRDELFSPLIDQFFTALGSAFFTPHPMAGVLMFVGLLITSRYLSVLAVAGFLCGFATYSFLSGSPHPDLVAWNGFNFILVAMALGGIFTVPGWQSFILAMVGAVIAALVTAASETFMLVYGLPVMALPFLTTTMLILIALNQRPASESLQVTLESPALPEKSADRTRLAIVRHGEFGSLPVQTPFYGRWDIYQGFDGPHTHQPPWQHALDFYIIEHDKSYRTDGSSLSDYYCFGLPVLSPVAGFVVKTLDSLPDNAPGQVDMENNWGNHVLIRMDNGLYALLAHLKQGSVSVDVGAYLNPAQAVAECGSSGRSPQPHLHLHVQRGETLGSPTYPFHLTAVMFRASSAEQSQFRLFSRPDEGQSVMVPKMDMALVDSMKMSVGREFRYQVSVRDEKPVIRQMSVVLNLAGELRLETDSGASAAFTCQDHLLAFYDREGAQDAFLDAWLLALGLTPFTEGKLSWQDQASMSLMPATWAQRLVCQFMLPLGGGIKSNYQRGWSEGHWQQSGRHDLHLPLASSMHVSTSACIEPRLGCTRMSMKTGDATLLEATLLEIGQRADAGIPAWSVVTGEGQE
ncbi:MAG: urea transporter [Mariprofundus sp.]|nr:urea transporter [Mariprofundus sp.]